MIKIEGEDEGENIMEISLPYTNAAIKIQFIYLEAPGICRYTRKNY